MQLRSFFSASVIEQSGGYRYEHGYGYNRRKVFLQTATLFNCKQCDYKSPVVVAEPAKAPRWRVQPRQDLLNELNDDVLLHICQLLDTPALICFGQAYRRASWLAKLFHVRLSWQGCAQGRWSDPHMVNYRFETAKKSAAWCPSWVHKKL